MVNACKAFLHAQKAFLHHEQDFKTEGETREAQVHLKANTFYNSNKTLYASMINLSSLHNP